MNKDADKESGWYANVLGGITNALGKFVGIFRKHGFVYSALAMVLFVSCYTLIINPIRVDKIVEKRFEKMYQTEKQKEAENVQNRIKADEIIGGIMTEIVDKFPEVQRILLLESHNSIRTTTSKDILFMTATMEMLTPNSRHFEYVSEDLQKQIRHNLMGGILNTLKYRDYIYYDSVQNCVHPEHRLLIKLKSVGDKEALLIPFKQDDMVQSVLVITGGKLPVDDIINYVNMFKSQIERTLF